MDYVLAVDLGGTKIYSALVGPGDVIVKRDVRPTEAALGIEKVIANILESIKTVSTAVRPQEKILGVGIGAPGPLDPASGRIFFAPNLNWCDVNLKEILEKELGLPVFMENDANLAALGEYLYGAGKGYDDLVFITVSTGVGGGLIIKGEIYSGASGAAGEIGHMVVVPDGPLCSCGNRGCLEAVASGKALKKRAQSLIAEGRCQKILELAGGDPDAVEAPMIAHAAHSGDSEARQLLAEAGRYLGLAIGNIANLLNPSIFIIGGGVARGAGDFLLEPARQEAKRHVFPAFRESLRVVPGALRGRAGVLGAAALAHKMVASVHT
ncbi:MAG: Glucokinase GlkA [Thermoanaerobacterales bacterium 50_218]|nr:MAG: Glucokinase GlkA [Thermoanaerobacterales bacterium 50_218]